MFIKRFVIYQGERLMAEGVVFSNGVAAINKEGADCLEIYASLTKAQEVYRSERGYKLALEPMH